MNSARDLEQKLLSIDGRGYKAYKSIRGSYALKDLTLHLDYIQGDPFAAPSRIRLEVAPDRAGFPEWAYRTPERQTALEDFLTRQLDRGLRAASPGRLGSGKGGLMAVDAPGQEIMKRTSMVIREGGVEARMVVGLPARGRRVMGRAARDMLLKALPPAADRCLLFSSLSERALRRHLEAAEDQVHLRRALRDRRLVAFLGYGSLLARRSGVSDLPLVEGIPLEADPELEVTLTAPNGGPVTGLGIPEGVTLIVGGGYHGKSTLLRALERGIYQHVPGDGRETVVSDPTSIKIRAEDGRRVEGVDISPFISNLPSDSDTRFFRTDAASGSTSQAANIMEAVELGTRCLLIDEDTSATNFMIRDARMQCLVRKDREPITPFVDRVRELWENLGISSVIVVGGSGDYLDVADTVIMMDSYRPVHVTDRARQVARDIPTGRSPESPEPLTSPRSRCPIPDSFDPRRGRKTRIRARGLEEIQFGREDIDLGGVEQLVHPSQTRAVGDIIHLLARKHFDGDTSLLAGLEKCMEELMEGGLDLLSPFEGHPGDYAWVRPLEIGAAINRLRTLQIAERK